MIMNNKTIIRLFFIIWIASPLFGIVKAISGIIWWHDRWDEIPSLHITLIWFYITLIIIGILFFYFVRNMEKEYEDDEPKIVDKHE